MNPNWTQLFFYFYCSVIHHCSYTVLYEPVADVSTEDEFKTPSENEIKLKSVWTMDRIETRSC